MNSNKESQVTSPTSSEGNKFIYFLARPGKPTVKPPKKEKSNGDGAKSFDATPMEFINDSFQETEFQLFSTKKPSPKLLKYRKLERHEIIRAALECGYGPKSWWTSKLMMETDEVSELNKFLLARLEFAISCIKQGNNKSWMVHPFYKQVEGSDKNPVSFILGGIGSFFAAENWLGEDDKMTSFLHKSIYGKAIVKIESTSSKSPDYLVEAGSKSWHLFESKGGCIGQRGNRLVQGLGQLDGTFVVGWHNGAKAVPKSCVCVHTRVDPKMSLDVMVIDPPADDVAEEATPQNSLVLIESVCKLLLVLRTIDQFRCLAGVTEHAGVDGEWLYVETNNFGGLMVGIPYAYLIHERELRSRMALYLAADECANGFDGANDSFEFRFQKEIAPYRVKATQDLRDGYLAGSADLDSLSRDIVTAFRDRVDDFRISCAEILDLNSVLEAIWPNTEARALGRLGDDFGSASTFTSGGMLIRVIERPVNQEG